MNPQMNPMNQLNQINQLNQQKDLKDQKEIKELKEAKEKGIYPAWNDHRSYIEQMYADAHAPSAITEPTERSIPPVRITNSIPSTTQIGPDCCSPMFRMFIAVRKVSDSSAQAITRATKIRYVLFWISVFLMFDFFIFSIPPLRP